jgi:hypothetical protein
VSKMASGAESVMSVISTIKDNPNRAILKSYTVPSDNFMYIIRTRYIQGWEPMMISSNAMMV